MKRLILVALAASAFSCTKAQVAAPLCAVLAQTIVGIIQQEFGQANCSLLLFDRESKDLRHLATAGSFTDQVKNKFVSLNEPGLIPQAIRTGLVVNTGDVRSIHDYLPTWEAARSEMTVPLKIGNEVIGVIDTQSDLPDAFNQNDERLMTIFAERVALALEHSRLYEQTEARVQQLAALRAPAQAILRRGTARPTTFTARADKLGEEATLS